MDFTQTETQREIAGLALYCLGGSDPPQTPPAHWGLLAPHTPSGGAARSPVLPAGGLLGPHGLSGGAIRPPIPSWGNTYGAPGAGDPRPLFPVEGSEFPQPPC